MISHSTTYSILSQEMLSKVKVMHIIMVYIKILRANNMAFTNIINEFEVKRMDGTYFKCKNFDRAYSRMRAEV
mgnify:CR=1 FL=1